MEEEREKSPSLPSNYLTLVQLQERWLKEQHRKQTEKEEERKRRDKEEEERNREEEIRKKQEENRNNLSRRNQSEKSSRTIVKSEKSQVGVIVVDDEKPKIDYSKKKKKGKARAEENLTGGRERYESEEEEKKTPVVLTETARGKEGVTREFQRNGKKLAVNGMVWEKKIPVNRSAEIGKKLNDVSLSGGKGGNERYARNMHGGQWMWNYKRDSGRSNLRKLQKPRDSNLVWVRKGNTSDVAEF